LGNQVKKENVMKLFEKIKIGEQREIRILGIPILQYGKFSKDFKDDAIYEGYISLLPSRSLKQKLLSKILHQIDGDYGDIYIVRANSGETYFLTSFIKVWQKNNNAKNPIVILTRQYHKDIFEMFASDIRFIFIPISNRESSILDSFMIYKKHRVYVYMTAKFFDYSDKSYKISKLHNTNCILNELKIKKKMLSLPKPVCNEDISWKIKGMELNIDKFIFIAPEASCCRLMPASFWYLLSKEFLKRGFDIFVNAVNPENKILGTKSCALTFKEGYKLASLSKGIVALRSGFCEFLSSTNAPKHIIYTNYPYRGVDVKTMMKSFTLKALSFFVNEDEIYEYDGENTAQDILLKNILKRF
jgi:hypothetical protein